MKRNILFSILLIIALPLQAAPIVYTYGLIFTKNIYSQPNSDIIKIPQNSKALTSNFSDVGKDTFTEYLSAYFAPWNEQKLFDQSVIQAKFSNRDDHFAENYQPIPEEFYVSIENNANISALNALKSKAIIINNTNLRVIPTNTLVLDNPYAPGEGYPFDYAQDDYLLIGEPLVISHYTKDGKFAYARTSSGATGFILAQDLAEIDDANAVEFRKNLVMFCCNTLIKLQQQKSGPALQVYVGAVLPLVDDNTVLVPIRNAAGKVDLIRAYTDNNVYISKPLNFSKQNVSKIVDNLINQPYGWGGNLFNMDCARLVRNYFAVFGVHMPLLSKEQGMQGKMLDISELNNDDKIAAIIKHCIPYQSVLYMPGHIGIYLGTYQDEPIMLHAKWGVNLYDSKVQIYKYVIGKSVISTLHQGQNLPGFSKEKSDLLTKTAVVSNLVN